jgi:hypothetical protein
MGLVQVLARALNQNQFETPEECFPPPEGMTAHLRSLDEGIGPSQLCFRQPLAKGYAKKGGLPLTDQSWSSQILTASHGIHCDGRGRGNVERVDSFFHWNSQQQIRCVTGASAKALALSTQN